MKFSFGKGRNGKRPRPERGSAANGERKVPFAALFLALLLWVSALVVIFSNSGPPHSSLAVGQRAPVTVVASADFSCSDKAQTELNQTQASAAVPPVFSINFGACNAAAHSIEKLFDRLVQLRQASVGNGGHDDQIDHELENVLDLLGFTLPPAQVRQLAPAGREEEVLEVIKTALKDVWAEGIASQREKETSFQGVASSGSIAIRGEDETLAGPVAVRKLANPGEALTSAVERVTARLGREPGIRNTVTALLKPWMSPNLAYERQETEERRRAAAAEIEAVPMKVRAGTTLAEAGDRITPQILEMLNAHDQRQSQLESANDRLVKRIGNAGLLLAALISCIGLLRLLKPEMLRQESRILLLITISLLGLLPAKGLLYLSTTTHLVPPAVVEFALPLALPPLLASILVGSALAIPLGLWNSFALAVLFNGNFIVFTLGLVVTVVAALTTQDVRRRSQIFRAGLLVGLAGMLYAVCFAAVTQQTAPVFSGQALTALVSGIASAFLAWILIPLFEMLFRITTNLTLLELSDMSNPLLQRLAMEAPGTYHHSVVVANLGEAAAAAVGANGLLVRVCAHFHDIGKLAKPEFFTENMHLADNPHDELSPSMSTLVITSHVKEGVAILRRAKMPQCVIAGVEQHHGTSLVSFFYRRAQRQEAEQPDGQKVSEEAFRYEGPRPSSRELGILSLADAVEAAARSLERPTPTRIENLVNDIVAGKLGDGQLDECDLTLAELTEIKRSFVFTLSNMLHVRVAYENKPAEPADKAPPAAGEGAGADRVAAEPHSPAPAAGPSR